MRQAREHLHRCAAAYEEARKGRDNAAKDAAETDLAEALERAGYDTGFAAVVGDVRYHYDQEGNVRRCLTRHISSSRPPTESERYAPTVHRLALSSSEGNSLVFSRSTFGSLEEVTA